VIDQASYGHDHPKVARDLNNLGLLLLETNRLSEAEPLLRRALAIDEASYGLCHPELVPDLWNLAALLLETNRLSEAEPLLRRAAAIRKKMRSLDRPDTRDQNNSATWRKVRRNEPCPCGSGKRYKHCHGKW
jgi:tetratricopeptide (TPR) repeat protein